MDKQVVEYKLKDTVFLVDIPQMCLTEKNNIDNRISVLAMTDKRTHYEFDYEPESKTLNPVHYHDPEGRETVRVHLPQLKDLDPDGTCSFFGVTKEELAQTCDYALMAGKDPYTSRIKNGVLPVTDLVDHPFFVDLRMGVLRPKDDFSTMGIDISGVDPFDYYHSFFYHVPSHSEYFPDSSLTELPKDVVKIIIPGPARLDPVGMARMEGQPDDFYLKGIPIHLYSRATVVPLEFTELPELVKANGEFVKLQQQKQQQEHQQKELGKKERKGYKRGF